MEGEKKSNGALIGLVVIIILLVIGGVYMWQKNSAMENNVPAQSETLGEQDSADLDSLEKDLETADTNIDASVINSVE